MAFRVQDFRASMNYDGARPNLFEVTMIFPLSVNLGGASQKLTFMARAAQLPGSTINSIVQPYFGREAKFAGNRTFQDWTVTIINDEDFKIRDSFELWMNKINSHVGNLRSEQFIQGENGYQVDAYVEQFGKTGDVIKGYKFVGMFPIDLSPIELDWGANDTMEEYAVTFAYQWWQYDSGLNGPTTDVEQTNEAQNPILTPIQ